MLIDIIAAEQTDFIKVAPIIDAIRKEQIKGGGIRYRLIYTGRFNDKNLYPGFFEQLSIPKPHLNLETGSDLSDIEQTATVMVRYEKVLSITKPQFVLITGDSNATMACAITAKKTHNIQIGHLESGLRNKNTLSPNELNSLIADSITDFYFTPSHSANENLRRIGVADERIFFVGNTHADTLQKIRILNPLPTLWNKLKLKPATYLLVCMHHSENMRPPALKDMLASATKHLKNIPIVFIAKQSSHKLIAASGMGSSALLIANVTDYKQFIFLLEHAKAVITDYNGIQEETTILQVPCITLGRHKERPETFSTGTNMLISEPAELELAFEKLMNSKWKKGNIPYMWDGHSAERILALLRRLKNK